MTWLSSRNPRVCIVILWWKSIINATEFSPLLIPLISYGLLGHMDSNKSDSCTIAWICCRTFSCSESESEVAQSCPTFCDPMDCSLPGSSLHGILQARVLEWGAISFSRGSSWPRDWTRVSHIPGRYFNLWVTREAWTSLKAGRF